MPDENDECSNVIRLVAPSDERSQEPRSIGDLARELMAKWEEAQARRPVADRPVEDAGRASEKEQAEKLQREMLTLLDRNVPLAAAEAVAAERVGLGTLQPTDALLRVRSFLDGLPGTLVLAGDPGCGKTVAAAWAVAGAPRERYFGSHPDGRRGSWPADYHKRFVDVTRLARMPKWGEQADKLLEVYECCALLAVDDVGCEVEDAKQAVTSVLEGLLVARHDNRLRTIITTNMDADAFFTRFGGRVRDRIRSSGAFFVATNPSLR